MIPAPKPVISTMEVLAQCGWVPDAGRAFSEVPALKYSFGNFELSAGVFTNEYLQQVVSFSGLYSDHRMLQQVAFDMPLRVASHEQALAWVAYGIGRRIQLAITPDWLEEGRLHRDLLPWEQEMAAYKRRPQASIGRDWMRVLGKQLREEAELASSADTCRIHFDGNVLRFQLPGKALLVQASGMPWKIDVIVKFVDLRGLPKRWMSDPISASFWEDHFVIGNRAFSAAIENCS